MPDQSARPGTSASGMAFHTILLLDASSSVAPLHDEIIAAANEMLDEIRAGGGVVSITYFNRDIENLVWRVPAAEAPKLSKFNYPTDVGTSLFDAITTTLAALNREHAESRGEMNGDGTGNVRIVVFTDGLDSMSRTSNLMRTRLSVGAARERGWEILFVSNVRGLAADLGIGRNDTVHFDPRPGGFRAGFRAATEKMKFPDPEAMRRDEERRKRLDEDGTKPDSGMA